MKEFLIDYNKLINFMERNKICPSMLVDELHCRVNEIIEECELPYNSEEDIKN